MHVLEGEALVLGTPSIGVEIVGGDDSVSVEGGVHLQARERAPFITERSDSVSLPSVGRRQRSVSAFSRLRFSPGPGDGELNSSMVAIHRRFSGACRSRPWTIIGDRPGPNFLRCRGKPRFPVRWWVGFAGSPSVDKGQDRSGTAPNSMTWIKY